MTPLRSILVVFVALILSVCFALPAEDVPETVYDESESLPCESTPAVSILAAEISVEVPTAVPGACRMLLVASQEERKAWQLDGEKSRVYASSDSLTILDHLLRC